MARKENDRVATSWLVWGVLLGILAVGTVLRLVVLRPVGLSVDECITYWASSPASVSDVWHRSLGYTTHPPLYFLLMHASLCLFGHSELSLRVPSLIAGSLAPAAAMLALRRLTRRTDVALLVALLVAVDPHQLASARIARPYALSALLTYLSVWVLAGLLHKPTASGWLAWAVCHAALVQCNYVFAGLAVQQALVCLVTYRANGRPLRGWVLGVAGLGGLLAPWAPHVWRLYERHPTLVSAGAPSLRHVFPTWLVPLLFVWAGAALVWVAYALLRRHRAFPFQAGRSAFGPRTGLTLVTWLVLPLSVLLVVSLLSPMNLFHPRYVACYMGAWIPVCACLWGALPRRWLRYLALGVLLPLLVATRCEHFLTWEIPWVYEDWSQPVRTLSEQTRPGDVVLFNAGLVENREVHKRSDDALYRSYVQAPLAGLYGTPSVPVVDLPPQFVPGTPHRRYMDERVRPKVISAQRVWVVTRRLGPDPLFVDVLSWLLSIDHGRFRLITVRDSNGVAQALVDNTWLE